MRRAALVTVLAAAVVAVVTSAWAQGPMSSTKPPEAPPGSPPTSANAAAADFDVNQLFASTCGWCHSDGGRSAGKGPKLMGTTLTDAEIIHRIKTGKPGAMPAFGSSFNDAQLQAIVRYIRSLHE